MVSHESKAAPKNLRAWQQRVCDGQLRPAALFVHVLALVCLLTAHTGCCASETRCEQLIKQHNAAFVSAQGAFCRKASS